MPNLTAKELSALEDQLNIEQIEIKKYKSYAQMATDPQIKSKFDQIATRHEDHYSRLLGHLS